MPLESKKLLDGSLWSILILRLDGGALSPSSEKRTAILLVFDSRSLAS